MNGHPFRINDFFIHLDTHTATFITVGEVPSVWHFAYARMSAGSGHKDNSDLVLVDGQRVLSRDHHVDGSITHVNIPPPLDVNLELPLIYWAATDIIEFGAHQVLCPDGPISVALFYICGPDLACNDPRRAFTSIAFTGGTVLVGFTIGDIIAGLLMALLDILVGWIAGFISGVISFIIAFIIAAVIAAVIAFILYAALNVFFPGFMATFLDELGIVGVWAVVTALLLGFMIKGAIAAPIRKAILPIIKPIVQKTLTPIIYPIIEEWCRDNGIASPFDYGEIAGSVDEYLGTAEHLDAHPAPAGGS